MLSHIESRVFLWNVFPLHPHKPGLPFTNRAHNAQERAEGSAILGKLVKLLNPKRIVAIGNDAELAASGFSDTCEIIKVRHPSYGGQTDFSRKITEIYSIKFGGLI
ncbi:MAG: uracil-DNA glycosylase [Sphingomonas ursincola]|nr:uracil-DNA glycosylase [Sphingomonas ursincola]MBY0619370.1 uracil-DNA glycosylase [Sphingomonas ursincola]